MNLRRLAFPTCRTALPVCLAVGLAVLAAPQVAPAYDYSYARVVRLSLVEGEVQVTRPETQTWEPAIVNLPIQQGYSVATGRGRAEIEFESGATVRLAEHSLLQCTELALSGGARLTKLTLTQGTATLYANLAREDSFTLVTPQLQVAIAENARFRVDVSDNTSTVSVLKGEVNVDSRAGTNRLTKGHVLTYSTSDPDRVALGRNAKDDAWDRWVADRDEVIHSRSSAALRYMSSPYFYGLADLMGYGNWYFVAGYGHCWQPFGLAANWYPFWDGRWVFYPGLGWTWISYEPWGWMPYHFGRWIHAPRHGWVWVPGYFQYWNPAPVTWMHVRGQVGWTPLAPHDRPGQPPANLPQGVVVNTSNGLIAARPNERIRLEANERPQVLDEPPVRIVNVTPPSGKQPRTEMVPPVPPGVRSSGQPGIVFDSKERKYVNTPEGPVVREERPVEARRADAPETRSVAPPQPQAPSVREAVPGQAPLAPPRSPFGPAPQRDQPRWEGRPVERHLERETPPGQRQGWPGNAPTPAERPAPRETWKERPAPPQPGVREAAPRPMPAPPPMRAEPQRQSAPAPAPAPRAERERPQKPQ